MKIIEFRIFLPLTIEETRIGHKWNTSQERQTGLNIEDTRYFHIPYTKDGKISIKDLPEFDDNDSPTKSDTLESQPTTDTGKHGFIDNPDITNYNEISKYGQYIKKHRFVGSNLPWYLQKLMPTNACTINEKQWDMYPYIKQITNNDFLKKTFRIDIDTIIRAYNCGENAEENIYKLDEYKLSKREVIDIDITEAATSSNYTSDEDLTSFKSIKTGRGPLGKKFWLTETEIPLVCCYKLVDVDIKIFPFQSKIESNAANSMRTMFTDSYAKLYNSIDLWHGCMLEDVLKDSTSSKSAETRSQDSSD